MLQRTSKYRRTKRVAGERRKENSKANRGSSRQFHRNVIQDRLGSIKNFCCSRTQKANTLLNDNSDALLEDEAEESADLDADDYMEFSPAELLDCLYEYKWAYRTARRHRNVAEAQVAEFNEEYGDLQTARDTQDEYVHMAQEESDVIKRGAEDF